MKITAHTLVKNEERYLWFAVSSVIDYVDKLFLWDTGSTDNTIQIVKELKKSYPQKIKTNFLKSVNINKFTNLRQKMLEETSTDWVLIVDGDEVWWDEKIKQTTELMRSNNKLQTIVNEYRNLIGDIYHYQDPKASYYTIDKKSGPFTIRAMSLKNIDGLKVDKPHGKQGFFNKDGILVQDLPEKNREWIEEISYLHFTHLVRSRDIYTDKKTPKRDFKYKYELGNSFDLDFYYPEVFFRNRPDIVESVWKKADAYFNAKATIQTPLKKIKRLLPHVSGY